MNNQTSIIELYVKKLGRMTCFIRFNGQNRNKIVSHSVQFVFILLLTGQVLTAQTSLDPTTPYNPTHLNCSIVPVIEWEKSIGGPGWDEAYSIQQTTDGGYVVAGDNSGMIKLDGLGNIEWQKLPGGEATCVKQTKDGGYIAILQNYRVGKLDSLGTLEWERFFGNSYSATATSLQQTTDDGYIVAGYFGGNYLIEKLDVLGNLMWQKSLGGSGLDRASSIQQTTDGGFVVAGSSNSSDGDVTGNNGTWDYWIVKLNPFGTIEWQKSYGGSQSERGNSIQQTTDGGYIVAGESSSMDGDVIGNLHIRNYWIIRLDPQGSLVWQKSYGGSYQDSPYSVHQTTDGGFVVGGYTDSTDGDVTGMKGQMDYWIIKLDPQGNLSWEKTLGGTGEEGDDGDQPNEMQQTADGGFIIVGSSESNDGDVTGNNGSSDVWVVKLSPELSAIASTTSVIHESLPGATDGAIDLTVTGGIPPYTFNWDNGATTEDLSALTPGIYCVTTTDANGCQAFSCSTVDPGTSSLGALESLTTFELYPNPANTTTTLDIRFSASTDVQLKVVNLLGQVLYTSKENDLKERQFVFDLQDYAAGTYLITLETEEQIAVKKMIVLR